MAQDTAGPAGAAKAIATTKTALHNADNFGHRDTGNKKAGDKPSYSAVRSTRAESSAAPAAPKSASSEFMGVRSNEAPELNTALQARDDAKKALEQ